MMRLKAYKNELIVGLSFLLLLITFTYKQIHSSGQNGAISSAGIALQELKEVISLKKIWGDKKIPKKIEKLRSIAAPSKTKWHVESKKLSVSFQGLNTKEFDRLIVKIMNLPVEIQKLNIDSSGSIYNVEFKCKW